MVCVFEKLRASESGSSCVTQLLLIIKRKKASIDDSVVFPVPCRVGEVVKYGRAHGGCLGARRR